MRTVLYNLFFLLLYGCTGLIYVDHSENLVTLNEEISSIISIAPEIKIYKDGKLNELNIIRSNAIEPHFYKKLERMGKRIGINYKVVNPETLITPEERNLYYSSLVKLKQNIILNINLYESNPYAIYTDSYNLFFFNLIEIKLFNDPVRIKPEFSNLSQKFGTPYFAYMFVYSGKSSTFFTHIVVNVETAEILYRDIRIIPEKLNKNLLPHLIYDSLAMLRKLNK